MKRYHVIYRSDVTHGSTVHTNLGGNVIFFMLNCSYSKSEVMVRYLEGRLRAMPWITVLLLNVVGFGSIPVSPPSSSGSSGDLEAMLNLLYLKSQNCTNSAWCNLGVREGSWTRLDIKCCESCSCKPGCVLEQSCCPDFRLYTLLDGRRFENYSELAAYIHQTRNTSMWQEFRLTETVHEEFVDSDDPSECVRLQILQNSSLTPLKGVSMKVVTRCTANVTDASLRGLCEDRTTLLPTGVSLLSTLTPVQSTRTGRIYRNRYCFRCSSESSHAHAQIDWMAYYLRSKNHTHLETFIYETVDQLVRFVLANQNYMPFMNIIFLPSTGYSGLDVTKFCTSSDIDTCSVQVPEGIERACRHVEAPITVRRERMGTSYVFKNLACLFCNDNRKEDFCFGGYRNPAEDTMLIQLVDTNFTSNTSGVQNTTLGIVFDTTGNCAPGFAYDKARVRHQMGPVLRKLLRKISK